MRPAVLAFVVASSSAIAGAVALPERGTIVFLGDSITWQNLYVRYVEGFLLRAYPERDLTVINRGVRGDTVDKARARIERDVVPYDPALVIIMLGVNDSGFAPPSGVRLSRYLRETERLIAELHQRTRAELLVMTPSCLGAKHRGANEMLAIMSRELQALGLRLGVEVLDIHTVFVAARASGVEPVASDSIHPNPEGHALIARELLATWAQSAGAQHELDACGSAGVAFMLSHGHRNASLPSRLASLNAYVMQVGDAACELELVVDGVVLGRFDADAWKRGVDLNRLPHAPWVHEARRIDELLREKWQWSYALWDPSDLGMEEALELVGGRWTGRPEEELRARAERELRRIRSELRAARSAAPVTYPAMLRPPR